MVFVLNMSIFLNAVITKSFQLKVRKLLSCDTYDKFHCYYYYGFINFKLTANKSKNKVQTTIELRKVPNSDTMMQKQKKNYCQISCSKHVATKACVRHKTIFMA